MSGYVGTNADTMRMRKLEQQRGQEKQDFEMQMKRKEENVANGGLRQFGTSAAEAVDEQFRKETVGLVTREEFASKRKTIEKRMLDEAEAAKEASRKAEVKAKEEREKKRMSKLAASRLSFLGGDDEDEDEEEGGFAAMVAPAKKAKFGKVGKNPSVDTSFLPDRDRDQQEQDAREKLKREYQEREEAEKNKPLDITFSYWDGSGHRRNITVRQGDSIGEFLGAVRRQLSKEFRNLRATSVENMIYIKEDLMIPQHYTFHELIVTKARGKSGPLFHFDVHDDVRLVNDATKEKEESHAGKIVERHWYEKNKHIFPASRWEVYDPAKTYDTYTIHGD